MAKFFIALFSANFLRLLLASSLGLDLDHFGRSDSMDNVQQCPPGYIFCLEEFSCVPDEPEFLEASSDDCSDDTEELEYPVECPVGTVFCVEKMDCVPKDPQDCTEDTSDQDPDFCPVGTIFCLEAMDCVPDPDLQFIEDEECETERKPGTPKPTKPVTSKPSQRKETGNSRVQVKGTSKQLPVKATQRVLDERPTSDRTPPTSPKLTTEKPPDTETKPTLPPGLAQNMRKTATNFKKKIEEVEDFIAKSGKGFLASWRKIFG